jgi:hypothetical protein
MFNSGGGGKNATGINIARNKLTLNILKDEIKDGRYIWT